MNISFHGAAREVTGSCYLVEAGRTRVLIDCGMFQGSTFADAKNFRDFGFDPATIDAVIVTHAHLDHVGRLPKLFKNGFRGKVYATPPTRQLAHIVLDDAEQIMEEDHRRTARPKLYEKEDVERVVELFVDVEYERSMKLPGLSFRFRDAGHIFGSAFVEIEERGGARVVFSGDVGNRDVPILRPTEQIAECDALVVESTYGNRLHEDESTREVRLRSVIQDTIKQNGVLIIPAFAIERTQEVVYELNHLVENKLIPSVDIYLDSPMAAKVIKVIEQYPQYYAKEATRLVATGDDMFTFPRFHVTTTREESKMINDKPRPKVIISGSGMMNGGRIRHHLIRYLGDARSTVLIIGYQAHGTLGRQLYTGEKHVTIMEERVEVRAKVTSIGAYSAHADQKKLLEWVASAKSRPTLVYCTHGEEDAAAALATRVTEELGIATHVPRFEEMIQV